MRKPSLVLVSLALKDILLYPVAPASRLTIMDKCHEVGVWIVWSVASSIMILYGLAYVYSPNIRAFARKYAGRIAQNMPTIAASSTMLALILAGVALLARKARETGVESLEYGFVWLAAATLFILAQLLLTRQVTGLSSYFAEAASYSLWWSLTLAICSLYHALLPDRIWTSILLTAPAGVLAMSVLSLKKMAEMAKKEGG